MQVYDTLLVAVGASLAGIAVASQVSIVAVLALSLVSLTLVGYALFGTGLGQQSRAVASQQSVDGQQSGHATVSD